jgi:hypothetical protein
MDFKCRQWGLIEQMGQMGTSHTGTTQFTVRIIRDYVLHSGGEHSRRKALPETARTAHVSGICEPREISKEIKIGIVGKLMNLNLLPNGALLIN